MIIMLAQKRLGLVLMGLSLALFGVVFSFTNYAITANNLLHANCPLPPDVCPLHRLLPTESVLGFILDGIIGVMGAYLFFAKEKPAPNKERIEKLTGTLDGGEKNILRIVTESGAVFQSELVEKAGLNKVKVTRILDKLEAKGIIERKRRGMTNIVVLKQ